MPTRFIKKIAYIGLFISFIVTLSGWGLFKGESSLQKDTEALNKVLNGFFVTYWKGAKLSIRALPIKKEMQLIDLTAIKKAHKENLPFGTQLQQAYNWEGLLQGIDEGRKKLNIKELTALGKDIYALPSVLKKTNEDDYPTALEVIANTRSLFQKDPVALPAHWNASMEHWLFAIAMEAQLGFTSWKTYELHGVTPSELQTTDLQTLAFIHKGINHLRNRWYHLADAHFTQALVVLAEDDITLLPHSERFFALFSSTDLSTKERFRNHVSGINYLLRSAARKQMGTPEATQLAQQDIAQTVSHFSQAGVDNEFTWLAQSYLHLQRQEHEKALETLSKLENSPLLATKEKALLADVKQQLQVSTKASSDNALTLLADSPIMYKLGMNYARAYLTEVTWTKLLETTNEGKNMLNHFVHLQETLEKTKQFMSKMNPLGDVIR